MSELQAVRHQGPREPRQGLLREARNDSSGFTLVEMIVTMAIIMVVMTLLPSILSTTSTATASAEGMVTGAAQAQLAIQSLDAQVASASQVCLPTQLTNPTIGSPLTATSGFALRVEQVESSTANQWEQWVVNTSSGILQEERYTPGAVGNGWLTVAKTIYNSTVVPFTEPTAAHGIAPGGADRPAGERSAPAACRKSSRSSQPCRLSARPIRRHPHQLARAPLQSRRVEELRMRARVDLRYRRADDDGQALVLVLVISMMLVASLVLALTAARAGLNLSIGFKAGSQGEMAAQTGLATELTAMRNTSSYTALPCSLSGSLGVTGATSTYSVSVAYSASGTALTCTGSGSTLGGSTAPTNATLSSTGKAPHGTTAIMKQDVTIAVSDSINDALGYAIFTPNNLDLTGATGPEYRCRSSGHICG